jgi:hypothetical protein
MGWWKVQGTEDVVGDDVFSVLREAALAVRAEYQKSFGRSPTRSEWERLMREAVEPIEDLESASKTFLMAEGTAPRSVKIILSNEAD